MSSVLLHTLIGLLLTPQFALNPAPVPVFEISIEPAQESSRIVPDSEATLKTPPKEVSPSARLASKDSTVNEESIRRGTSEAENIPVNTKRAQKLPKSPGKAPTQSAPKSTEKVYKKQDIVSKKSSSVVSKKPLDLKLSSAKLLTSDSRATKTVSEEPAQQNTSSPQPPQKPFDRPAGAPALFLGKGGVPDVIPNVRDGDITLLNTKASEYAVFVRRVATRVFSSFSQKGWQVLSPDLIRSLKGPAHVKVTLRKDGQVRSVEILNSSNQGIFDSLLRDSASKGSSDPNPPLGAQNKDGEIVLHYLAMSWVRIDPSPRGPARQQRWLQLQVGMD